LFFAGCKYSPGFYLCGPYSKTTERKSEGAEEVADGFGGVEEGRAADFVEAEPSVEGVGDGIGRDEIDFADDASVAGGFRTSEEFGVEGAGVAFAAGGVGDDDSVHIDKILVGSLREVPAEPAEVFVWVGEGLIEGDEQSVRIVDRGGEKGCANDLVEFGECERRKFDGVGVVEGEEWFGGSVDLLGLGGGGHGRGTLYYGGEVERRSKDQTIRDQRPETREVPPSEAEVGHSRNRKKQILRPP